MSETILAVGTMSIPDEYTLQELQDALEDDGEEYEIAEHSANEIRVWFGLNEDRDELFVSLYESDGEGSSLLRAESEEILEKKRDRVIDFLTNHSLLSTENAEEVEFEVVEVLTEDTYEEMSGE